MLPQSQKPCRDRGIAKTFAPERKKEFAYLRTTISPVEQANEHRADGFAAEPPSGPAMPVNESAISASRFSAMPRAHCRSTFCADRTMGFRQLCRYAGERGLRAVGVAHYPTLKNR
jgi:hypothetical protein